MRYFSNKKDVIARNNDFDDFDVVDRVTQRILSSQILYAMQQHQMTKLLNTQQEITQIVGADAVYV